MDQRSAYMIPEKRRIATTAAALLASSHTVFLDEGYTAQLVAEQIVSLDLILTAVTMSIPIAATLAASDRITVHLLGGHVRPTSLGTSSGQWAQAMLGDFTIDTAVMGTSGITIERGVTTPAAGTTDLKASALRMAGRSVLVAVSTKFGANSFARFAHVADFDVLITDRGLTRAAAVPYHTAGPTVLRV